jgi:hypothetical protein
VSEWLKEHAWKVCIWETVSRVRIPLSPLERFQKKPKPRKTLDFTGFFVFSAFQKESKNIKYQKRHSVRRGTSKLRRTRNRYRARPSSSSENEHLV